MAPARPARAPLCTSASDQIRELAETAKAEREAFGQSTLQSMGEVSEAASKERTQLEAQTRAAIDALAKAAEETRAAAAQHAETARQQVDQLSEAAFTAGQKANQVFEARLAEARATALRIAANAPISVRQAKKALDKATELDRMSGYAFEIEAYNRTVVTEDRQEGIDAFNEKRKPQYKGR